MADDASQGELSQQDLVDIRIARDKLRDAGDPRADKVDKFLQGAVLQFRAKQNAPSLSPDRPVMDFGPLEGITRSQFRKVTATLPWIGGGIGGILGAPGVATGVGGAALGGGAGTALEKLLNLAFVDRPESQTSTGNLKDIAVNAGVQGATQGVAEAAAPLVKAAAPALKESAAKSLEQVLGATRQTMKAVATEKVVPEILDREVVAGTRKGLFDAAKQAASEVGSQIDAAVTASTASGKQIEVGPIVQSLENAKNAFILKTPAGGISAARPEAIAKITEIQHGLMTYGENITPTDLVNFRRFFDAEVSKGKMAFLVDPAKGFNQQAQEAAVNSIRDTLNKEVPDLAALNAQFHFWRNLQTVMDSTLQRTASQSGVVTQGMKVLRGGGLGAAIGQLSAGPGGAAVGGLAGTALSELMQSTAWRTVSAVNKNRLATFLAKGDLPSVNALALRIGGAAVSASTAGEEQPNQ